MFYHNYNICVLKVLHGILLVCNIIPTLVVDLLGITLNYWNDIVSLKLIVGNYKWYICQVKAVINSDMACWFYFIVGLKSYLLTSRWYTSIGNDQYILSISKHICRCKYWKLASSVNQAKQ